MEIALKINNVLFLYRKLLNKLEMVDLNFNEAILLYSIKIGKDRVSTISDFIEKDKSYVHRKLQSLLKKNMIEKERKKYLLSHKGKATYKKISLFNRMLINKCEYLDVDVNAFKELIGKFEEQYKNSVNSFR